MEIELTKHKADLRCILDKEWGVHTVNINIQYYKIYWSDKLLAAIRKVEFTESGEATFLTSEMGMSLLQLMPRTVAEEARVNAKRQACNASNRTLTYTEAKKDVGGINDAAHNVLAFPRNVVRQ